MADIRIRDGVIEDINEERGATFVAVRYHSMPGPITQRVVLVVSRDTMIFDENGRRIPARELEEGMVIDAVISEAMTRSIPPQSQAIRIRVKERVRNSDVTFGRILEVNDRENFILVMRNQNPSSLIRFNVGPDTRIEDLFGRRIRLSQLVPGLRVRVEHAGFMTASIPPQSPAFEIRMVR